MDHSSYDNDNSTADTSAIIATIRETLGVRLKSVIGLHTINDGWLLACVRYLQQRSGSAGGHRRDGGGGNSGSQDDDILYQILHSDLRDVIRGGCSTKTSSSSSSSSSRISQPILPAEVQQLQEGISKTSSSSRRRQQRSSSSSNNNKIDNSKPLSVVLPQNFRLLCQIEEVVDMSQPSERRLLGSSSASSQQQQQQLQQQPRGGRPYYNNSNNQPPGGGGRCLKICLVHGYKINGATMDDDLHTLLDVVIGMESASSIPGLAPGLGGTKAGTKVLLKGPIEIRGRMLLLHGGNCIVLGGCIPWYTWRQRSSLINAKNMAGVGVDPTVRALIGTNPIDATAPGGAGDDDENNDDEGHESSSSEYHPHHRTTHPAATSAVQAQAPYQSIFATGQRNSTVFSLSSSSSPSSAMPPPQQQNNRSAWAHSSTTTTTTHAFRQQPQSQPPPRHAPGRADSNSLDSSSRRNGVVVDNPYSNVTGRAPSSSTSAVAPSSSSRSPIPPPASNPYARHRSQSQPQPSQHGQSRTTPPTIRPGNISSAATNRDVSIDRMKNYNDLHSRPKDVENRPPSIANQRDIISSVSPASNHAAGAAAGQGTASTIHQATPTITSPTIKSTTSSSSSSSIQVMTFESLYTLLSQLLKDREMYQSYHQQEELSFKVRLVAQTSGSRIVFNVDKVKKDKSSNVEGKKKKKKKDGKKYQYRVVTTFGDGDRPESSLTSSSSKVIACKIDPMIVEPHFPVSAGELRSLSRTDRDECHRLTKRGEASIKAANFLNSRVWSAKLLPSAEELFGPGEMTSKSIDDRLQDVEMPVLLLQ